MKTFRFMAGIVLMSISAVVFAQSDGPKSFDNLKALAGSWEGKVTTVPPQPDVQDKAVQVSLRVTSMGNALMHEVRIPGQQDDPITMLYLDGDRLMLTHYCDAGNRPRMEAKTSTDGKTVDFGFLDVAGSTAHGHMHHVMFSIVDADHHSEEWTYMMPTGQPVQAHFELQRTK